MIVKCPNPVCGQEFDRGIVRSRCTLCPVCDIDKPCRYLTWNDLLTKLQEMSAEQLDQDVTVRDAILDEFSPIVSLEFSKEGDVADGILDHGHAYLETEA